MRRIGILGGTFDPIHYGHLRLAQEALQHFGLDRIRFIPAAVPPHRRAPAASCEHRVAMTQLAVENNPLFMLDERESRRAGKSYTVDTLKELREENNDGALYLIIGGDAFAGLAQWMKWRELFELCHVIVGERPGSPFARGIPDELQSELNERLVNDVERLHEKRNGGIAKFAMTPLDISASGLRRMIALNQNPRYLLPDCVLGYIQTHLLYREPDDAR